MRPQHVAADHPMLLEEYEAVPDASMRPQHVAADHRRRDGFSQRVFGASMRPQHVAADHLREGSYPLPGVRFLSFNEAAARSCGSRADLIQRYARVFRASMRPQHVAADHENTQDVLGDLLDRFNEAAACSCGSHKGVVVARIHLGRLQ